MKRWLKITLKVLAGVTLVLLLFVLNSWWFFSGAEKTVSPGMWKYSIPQCPCELPDPMDVKDGWATDIGDISHYHPGATVCIRSYHPELERGQQCCYDDLGKLITKGPGAGTPDLSSSCNGETATGEMTINYWGAYKHYFLDVLPFERLGWEEYNKLWKPSEGACDPTDPW